MSVSRLFSTILVIAACSQVGAHLRHNSKAEEEDSHARVLRSEDFLHGLRTIQSPGSGKFLTNVNSNGDLQLKSSSPDEWFFDHVGVVCQIQARHGGNYLDAARFPSTGYRALAKEDQSSDFATQKWTQLWALRNTRDNPEHYKLQQMTNGRYLTEGSSFDVATRPLGNDNDQLWTFVPRYFDAPVGSFINVDSGHALKIDYDDYSTVTTQPRNRDGLEDWIYNVVGRIYTIRHVSSGRYLDAYENGNGFKVVSRDLQDNDSQLWVVAHDDEAGDNVFTMQQLSSIRFAQNEGHFAATRLPANSDVGARQWVLF